MVRPHVTDDPVYVLGTAKRVTVKRADSGVSTEPLELIINLSQQPSISKMSDINVDNIDRAIESLRREHSPSQIQDILLQRWRAITSPTVAQPRSSATVRLPSTTDTSTLETSTLKTVTVVSGPARPPKDLCLSNLYQIEQDYGPLSNGYSVIRVGSSYSDVGGRKIYRGDVQQQQFQCEEHLVYLKEADGAPTRLFDDKAPFTMPSLEDISSIYAASELEQLMEDELAGCSDLETSQDYLIAAAHTTESRKQLGLPESPLEAGTCLLSTLKHYPGIHSSYAYVSTNHTKFALHVEDFYLKSANLLHAGAAKLWVIINPQCTHKLEGRLAELLKIQSRCSQFLRHKMLLLSPSVLRSWRIQFSMVIQQSGDLILIDSNAYHYGVNLGPNIAEAINYSDPDWIVPPTYRDCVKNKGCGDTKHMMSVKMKMGSARALDVEDHQEIGLKTSYPKQHSHSQAPTSKQTDMVLRSRSSYVPVKQYPKSTPTPRHITTRSAQGLRQSVKGKAEKDEKQKGRKDKDGEMEIDEGGEGEKDKKGEAKKNEKGKGEEKMEVKKDEKDKEGEGEEDEEGEKGESESEGNKKIEAEKGTKGEAEKNEEGEDEVSKEVEGSKAKDDENGEARKNEEGEDEVSKEVEGSKAKDDENGEARKNEEGEDEVSKKVEGSKAKDDKNGEARKNEEGEKNEKSGVKTGQIGEPDKDKRRDADAENGEMDGVEKIDGMRKETLKRHNDEQEDTMIPKPNGQEDAERNEANNSDINLEGVERMFVQKQKSTESIESADLCKIFDLTLTENDDDGEEEEEKKDFDTDEKLPAYEAGDSVGEIQWWIRYAILHHKESTWSSFPSTTQSTEQLQHDLSCFDPTQEPVQETWLNDCVILHVLESLFLFDNKTQVLDPVNLTKALKERDTRFLYLEPDMTHLIAPYHQNDHWCLFIINLSDGTLEVYDTTKETNPAAQFLEDSLSTSVRWTVTHKPLFPGPSDQSNCGVFTIAHSEAFLNSGQLPSTCPIELRLRYIRRLVKPLYDELESARHLGPSQVKRKGSFTQISTAEHQTKRVKHLPFASSTPGAERGCALSEAIIAEKISSFGTEWTQFYQDQVFSQGRTPEDMHLILALVSAVGCPQVMADLTDMLREPQTPPPGNNRTQAALNLYTNAEKSLFRSKIWMRYASIYMYLAFEDIRKSVRSRQGSWKVARRKAARQDKRLMESGASTRATPPRNVTNKAASYALDQLAADALGVSHEELLQHERRKAYRQKIRKIKDEGKAAHTFNEICKQKLWILVPAQNMGSPLDDSFVVKPSMYLQLSPEHMRLFAYALQELRPKLGYLISRAADLDSILHNPSQDRRITYQLEELGPEAILKEELDSHDLLHCLDEVPASV